MPSRLRAAPEPEHAGRRRAAPIQPAPRHGEHVVEMQRQRLLSALVELAAEQSVDGTTVGTVCKRAGVSRRTFYELFEDLEACVLQALRDAVSGIAERMEQARLEHKRWHERTRAALCVVLERFDREPGVARLCVVESLRAGPAVMRWRKEVLDSLAFALDEGRSESERSRELPTLTAQGVIGGALSVLHGRLLEEGDAPLAGMANALMAMIVHPYLGPAAARRELERAAPDRPKVSGNGFKDPFKGLPIRFTYRTALVLASIASEPAASNRVLADASGISDEGQMSRLLRRLERSRLIENLGAGHIKGEPNAWVLTERGEAVHAALGSTALPAA